MLRIIYKILQVYSLLILLRTVLPYFYRRQNRWTVLLDKICEPAVALGRRAAQKVLGGRTLPFDVGPFAALILLWLVQFVLNLIF